jgi:tRNA (cytidine/uridine-2'-O-)-methyltransferase
MIASFVMSDALYLAPLDPRLHLVLVNPQIPPNTGNVARLCAVTGTPLHLVAPLGFSLSEKRLRRAGLDYWDKVHAATHASFEEMVRENAIEPGRLHLFTARATRTLWDTRFRPGDWIVLGEEQKGLPEEVLGPYPERWVRVPMIAEPSARSLNLSTCAGIALYEALRQSRLITVQ